MMQVFVTGNPYLDALCTVQGLAAVLAVMVFIVSRVTARNIPGPTGLPILGSTFAILRNHHRFLDWCVDLHDKYGDTFSFNTPFLRFVAFTQPEAVEYMLKTKFWDHEKGPEFREKFHEVLGYGIFTVDGDSWKVQRKQASHMFSVNSFRNHMAHVFNRNGTLVLQLLEKASASGEIIDLQNILFRFTLDSVGEISFGSNVNSLSDPTVPFSLAFDQAQAASELRFWQPWWKLQRALGLGGEGQLKKSVKVMDAFSREVIRKRRAESAAKLASRGDLLSRFMELKDKNGKPLSDDFLRDVIMNFMIAGRDTTANAMSWAAYLVATHPEVETTLYNEVADLPDEPTYDQIKALKYCDAVLTETLRLYPSVPKDGVQAVRDNVFPDGTQVKKGDMVVFLPYVMGRMKSIWGEDCREFKPERFVGQPMPSQFKFPVFKAGPRICLGRNMAYFESASLLSKIFKRYRLEIPQGWKPHYAPTVTLPMRDGLRVRVKRR